MMQARLSSEMQAVRLVHILNDKIPALESLKHIDINWPWPSQSSKFPFIADKDTLLLLVYGRLVFISMFIQLQTFPVSY